MRHEQRNSPGRQSDCVAKFHAQKVPNALLRFMSKMAYRKKNRQAEQKPRGQPAQPEPTAMTTPLAAPLSYAASLAEPQGVGGQIASSAHSLLPPPLLLVPLLNVHLSQSAHSASFGRGTIQCRLRPLSQGIMGRRGRLIQVIRSFFLWHSKRESIDRKSLRRCAGHLARMPQS
jgi:hypothetical protein